MPTAAPQPSRREQRLIALKAPNYHAKRGEVIAGNLKRGDDGKFASAGSPSKAPAKRARRAAKPKKAPKPAKVKLTPEQRKQQGLQARQQEREQNRATAINDLAKSDEMNPGAAKALLTFADNGGEDPQYTDGLVKSGLMERGEDGKPRLSATGRAAVNALNRGDARGAADRLSKGQSTEARRRERATARQQRAAEIARRKQEREAKKKQPKGGGGGGGKKKDTKPSATDTAFDRAIANLRRISGKAEPSSFTVIKDATGRYRWIAISSTAYQDRDGEVVSTKALTDDVLRADSDGKYGPLRWWHVGEPNPLDLDEPWGPGVDLGWCDFNAMHGRTLIESGTFVSEEIGAAVAAKADDHAISIGFIKFLGQPDTEKVFNTIHRFERSLAPKERVSNPYTSLMMSKETTMEDAKRAALKALGVTDAMIAQIDTRVETTQKAAEANGVRFKADDGPPAEITINGVAYALKAPFPPVAEEEKAPADVVESLDDTIEAEPIDDGNMLNPGEIKAIADAVVAAMAPILGMEAKIGKMMEEVKASMSGFGGQVAKKDSEIADLHKQIADAQQRLKTLEGDQPAIGSNRASESTDAAAIALMLKQSGIGTQPTTNNQEMFAEWILSGQPPTAQ